MVLGSITSLDLKFDKDYWLGTEVEADGEMTPRQRLTSSAYTYRAEYAAKGGTVAYTGQGEVSYSFSNELSIHLETSPSSVKLYLWGEASIDGNYPDGVEIKINGVDRTSEILALANSNWGSGNSSLGDGTSSHPLVSGANGVTGTGELDITNLVVWSAGEHTIEFSQTGSAKGKIRYNAYVTY